MCGIAGLIWKDRRPATAADVAPASEALAHRGPDDDGLLVEGSIAFAHRRLSILDPTPAGHQPMSSPDGTLTVIFNGEIYNYVELREELRGAGAVFKTGSDTEVLLAAYRHWGPACVERFNGMWAFALLDRPRSTVFLSRDRLGIKPLHFADDASRFVFASEVKGLLAISPGLRRPRYDVLGRFLETGALCDGPESFFEDVQTLLPGHNAELDLGSGKLRSWCWWRIDPSAPPRPRSDDDAISELRELLRSAVALHLRSDVPVGTCLSGGIDSSTIVCLTSELLGRPVHTYSGVYPDRGIDESKWIAAVARRARTLPCAVEPAPGMDFLEELRAITWHQDYPSAGPGLFTQWRVMRRASRDLKVLLDGQGADELFAGYVHYLGIRVRDLHREAHPLRALSLSLAIARHWGLAQSGLAFDEATRLPVGRVLRGVRRRLGGTAAEPPLLHPALSARIGANGIRREPWPNGGSGLRRSLQAQLARESLPALLHYEDRNSMAHSIEARVPLLDHRIVELALSLPDDLKVRGSWTKWILRKAAEPFLPREITWRRSKLGYPTPFARWLREPPLRAIAEDALFSPSFRARELVDDEGLKRRWDAHQAGAADHSWLFWRCLTTELWFRSFVDAWQPSPVKRESRAQV